MKLSFVLFLSILVTSSLGAQAKPGWRAATPEELKSRVAIARPGGERTHRNRNAYCLRHYQFAWESSLPAWYLSLQGTRLTANTLTTSWSRRRSQSPTSLSPPALTSSAGNGRTMVSSSSFTRRRLELNAAQLPRIECHREPVSSPFASGPPGDQSILQIGRFSIPYRLTD